jgi:hypothetical protein
MTIIATIIAFLLAVLAIIYISGGMQRLTAPFRGETEKIERTEGDGAFRQSAYEDFFGLCAAVQTMETRINALEDELAGGVDDSREARIRTSLSGLAGTRAEKVNEYNSLAAQEHRSAFKDADLPPRLYVNEMETTCA